jgi:uncharacterized protein YcfJ
MDPAPAENHTALWYGVGAVLAIMIGGAVGQSFVAERGKKLVPYFACGTVVLAVLLGWAMNEVMTTLYASAFTH